MRMLMNNLDEDVAERPQDLVIYGGTGKAARNWDCYHAIVRSLKSLENDETPIGDFGEIEGKADWIDQIARKLEITDDKFITQSYTELFFAWQRKTGSDAHEMTFAAVAPL